MFIRWSQSLRRSVNILVRQHRIQRSTQTAGGRHHKKWLEGFGRPVVVSVAVSEREAADALRVQCGDNLCNPAAAVLADDIHLIDAQSIEKFISHLVLSRYGN